MNVPIDEQIHMTIAIVVAPRRASAESARAQPSFFRNVFEFTIPHIAVKHVCAIPGHIQVLPAIIVVINDRHAYAPTFASQACRFGDVAEFEIGILVVQRDHQIATLLVAFNGRSVHRQDVELSIIVAINKSGAAAHRLDNVVLILGRNIGNSKPGLFPDVFKLRNCRRRSLPKTNRRTEKKKANEPHEIGQWYHATTRVPYTTARGAVQRSRQAAKECSPRRKPWETAATISKLRRNERDRRQGPPGYCAVSVKVATGCPNPYGPSAVTATVCALPGSVNVTDATPVLFVTAITLDLAVLSDPAVVVNRMLAPFWY